MRNRIWLVRVFMCVVLIVLAVTMFVSGYAYYRANEAHQHPPQSDIYLIAAIIGASSQEEVISNSELNKSPKSTERFCRVITSYCTELSKHYPSDGSEGFIRHLKTIYYVHRSGFVHSGKEVSIASSAADRAGFPAITHFEDGKEISTPGLNWFFDVVHDTLLGFLATGPKISNEPDLDAIARIARDSTVLTMRAGG